MKTEDVGRYYTVVGTQRFGSQVHTLIRFNLPEMSRDKRRKVLDAVMEEREAEALVECFWTKGSLIHKNMRSFDAILITRKT